MGSKFVLQIRRPQYWRIELPLSTPEEGSMSQTFREVLEQILQFEKTHCPFQRPFTVFIPEQLPTIKKPWKPVPRPPIDESERPTSPTTSDLEGAMSTWYTEHGDPSMLRRLRDSNVVSTSNFQLFQDTLQFFSDAAGKIPPATSDEHHAHGDSTAVSSSSALVDGKSHPTPENTDILKYVPDNNTLVSTESQSSHEESSNRSVSKKSRSRRAAGFTPIHSGTLPPQLSLVTSPSMTDMMVHDSSNDVSSQESCHNTSSWPSPATPLPPSPPMSQPESPSVRPHYPDEAGTSTALTRRKETQKWASRGSLSIVQRAMSSLPDAVLKPQLSQPPRLNLPSTRAVRRFPMNIIIKMCQALLGIPSYLVTLMLRVTRRILRGESRGQDVGYSDDGERIPVRWDYSESESDDFGVNDESQGDSSSHRNKSRTQGSTSLDENQIWGVD
ncbi:hypothetical protein PT974_06566 [Cladobotryum mycophilum]|uniref:Inheritance of peroxisomes protein 1 n=1 Tax=Cladobotryum mycophilum TaxID=491253 RepID=A0ABR0SLZ8_9HYPO